MKVRHKGDWGRNTLWNYKAESSGTLGARLQWITCNLPWTGLLCYCTHAGQLDHIVQLSADTVTTVRTCPVDKMYCVFFEGRPFATNTHSDFTHECKRTIPSNSTFLNVHKENVKIPEKQTFNSNLLQLD